MRVGVFGDTHDHVDNMRRAVSFFNEAGCKLVLHAGDFCSPIVLPPLRKLFCPLISVFGDNDGNLKGIQSGMRILGGVANGPVCCTAPDGTRFLLMREQKSCSVRSSTAYGAVGNTAQNSHSALDAF